jgi:dimethylhistidine N-methyltransferase
MREGGSGMSARQSLVPAMEGTFAEEVEHYLSLTPRQLPSRFLYDELGSALFDAICRLPWYHITRGELRLLRDQAPEILATSRATRIIELGSGSGEKLATLLTSASTAAVTSVHLIDISAAALGTAERRLREVSPARLVRHQASYHHGLDRIEPAAGGERTLVMFLGSNIGNFDPPGAEALIRAIRRRLSPGDALLLGADLVKPEPALLLAYDDPLGVTAAFNRNLLVRINRELGGDFDLTAFGHRAMWNAPLSRIEMHLVSRWRQRIRVSSAGVDIDMAEGEFIWTESSYKYRPAGIVSNLEAGGFRTAAQWIDPASEFALTLAEAGQAACDSPTDGLE